MNAGQLAALGKHLNERISFSPEPPCVTGCDQTLRHTVAWLRAHKLQVRNELRWLQRRGGVCDCGVIVEVLGAGAHGDGWRVDWPRA